MQINEECIRDILKYLTGTLDVIVMKNQYYRYDTINAGDISNDLYNYEIKDILYSLKILKENHFITGVNLDATENAQNYNEVLVFDVTYRGHQFYENIQPDDIWKKTKSIVSRVGNHALNFVEQTEQMIASETAKQAVTIMMKK